MARIAAAVLPIRKPVRTPAVALGVGDAVPLPVAGRLSADQLMRLRDPRHALARPAFRQHFPGHVHNLHVVVVLSPIIT